MFGIASRERWEAYRNRGIVLRLSFLVWIERAMLLATMAPFAAFCFYDVNIFGICAVSIFVFALIHYGGFALRFPHILISTLIISAAFWAVSLVLIGASRFDAFIWCIGACWIFACKCEGIIRQPSEGQ